MLENIKILHILPSIDSKFNFVPFWSMKTTPVESKGFMAENNHPPAILSSVVSVPSSEVCSQTTLETISKSSSAGRTAKRKTESKTKALRKRGRPKGKKTTSHPLLKRPKRPLSGYNLFFRDQTEEIADTAGKKKGSLKFAELAKTIGARWKAVDASTRTIYESRGAAEMAKHQLDMKEYNHKVKILDESEKSKTSDADNGSVSDLSSVQEDAGSIHGQVNNQEDEMATFQASATRLGNHDAAQTPLVHSNNSTSHEEDAQTVVRVASATLGNNDAAHIPFFHDIDSTSHATANVPPSSTQLYEKTRPFLATDEDSPMPITQQLDQLDTNATASEVTASEIATPEPEQIRSCRSNSDESDFTFKKLIEDTLGFDDDESKVPDASFLVSNCKF